MEFSGYHPGYHPGYRHHPGYHLAQGANCTVTRRCH